MLRPARVSAFDDGVLTVLFARRARPRGHPMAALIEIESHSGKDLAEHVRGQHARIGIVARAVIAVEEHEPVGCVLRAMSEREGRKATAKRCYCTVMGDTAQQNERL